jgi:hypothetical protein
MKDSSRNIKFHYMYRDGANYKQHAEIVFTNPENLEIEEIESELRARFISSEYFTPKDVGIPALQLYAYDAEIDHDWHEMTELTFTDEKPTDNRSITEFIASFSRPSPFH